MVYWYDTDYILRKKTNYCRNCKPLARRYTRLYRIYKGIKQRCYNKNNTEYKYYGTKGIKMCEEWFESYDAFMNWALDNGYDDHLTIDRINNDGDYCAENCRWITQSENTIRSNRGAVKSHSRMYDMYALSPNGEIIIITNIAKFCRNNNINYASAYAYLSGKYKGKYNGWLFHSNKTDI